MAYEHGKTYWLISHGGTGKALSVFGFNQVSQDENVEIWEKTSNLNQQWKLSVLDDGSVRVKSKVDNRYALNICKQLADYNNCDIRTWKYNRPDSSFVLQPIDITNNIYKLKLANKDLFLSTSPDLDNISDGNNVYFDLASDTNEQQWELLEVDSSEPADPSIDEESLEVNYLIYPCKTMNILSAHNSSGEHMDHFYGNPSDYPIDEVCSLNGMSYFYCPCDQVEITHMDGIGEDIANRIILASTSPVVTPTGTYNVCIMVQGPGDLELCKLKIGQKFNRGDAMFREGSDGVWGGLNQFHISVGSGEISTDGFEVNSFGATVLKTNGNNLMVNRAFYVDESFTTVVSSHVYEFESLPQNNQEGSI